jgi:hypothetical protein
MVYDSTGRLHTAFAKRGSGPRESPVPLRFVIGPGDTLVLFDYERINVYSPTHEFVRSFKGPVPFPVAEIMRPDGSLLFAAKIGAAASAGYPLHMLSPTGAVVRSFGTPTPDLRPDQFFETRRMIAKSGDSLIWSAHINRYVFDLYDYAGTLRRVVSRDASWFRPWTGSPQQILPYVGGVWEDPSGLLWARLATPDPNWRRAIPNVGSEVSPLKGIEYQNTLYDTVIEVMDPKTGKLLATRKLAPFYDGFSAGGLVWCTVEDSDGYPSLEIFQVRLKRP